MNVEDTDIRMWTGFKWLRIEATDSFENTLGNHKCLELE
jgi:hypothetical protein